MPRFFPLVAVCLLIAWWSPLLGQIPRVVLAEEFTATW